ncbi:GNAT family N-acetyltransferase [Carnobacterium divergens]|uniref:GNAT family N-acetyltransferase n=1 Tax=Carnobacterium divergens TaxID=2748 RepID=UPI0007F5396F|nr:GNAT family N-acetyltransferase [Carnobacterium divergens]MDT1940518.1 GNAT family N-acetyltransferase [Carnobacterium divergens]MDT1942956.1 GNAT family N-acetyltransferase [Carnobacterium divergens]MDT1948762.1 GNAT family N-acetyltransferase [Carnobacterium divergens]MDT1951243.1 GNAT family N-acetyltransferase [Carnobacterium divergens]MDT1956301.1 GNAT family N-acetyltransferase [Carnobacterium divergens]
MNTQLKLNKATMNDYPLITELLIESAKWLKSKGSKQWNGILEGKDNHDTKSAIERGDVFYFTMENSPVGMCILWNKQSSWDQELWGVDKSDHFFYLHRLAINRHYSGQGIAMKILTEVEKYSKKENKKEIRLDCIADNQVLNKLYQDAGFNFYKTIYQHNAGEQIADFNLYKLDC